MTEAEREQFAAWVRMTGVMNAATALGECTSSVMHAALGTAKPSTARRVRNAWASYLENESAHAGAVAC